MTLLGCLYRANFKNLTVMQLMVLLIVHKTPVNGVALISRQCDVSVTSMHAVCNLLMDRGIIGQLPPSKEDKRRRSYFLTPAGQQILAYILTEPKP